MYRQCKTKEIDVVIAAMPIHHAQEMQEWRVALERIKRGQHPEHSLFKRGEGCWQVGSTQVRYLDDIQSFLVSVKEGGLHTTETICMMAAMQLLTGPNDSVEGLWIKLEKASAFGHILGQAYLAFATVKTPAKRDDLHRSLALLF